MKSVPGVISPDGSQLAFVGDDEAGNGKLWIRPLEALAAQPLSGTANAVYPFWPPDSRLLGIPWGWKTKKSFCWRSTT
jgi:hypothetical protein